MSRYLKNKFRKYRGSHPEVFLGKGVLKICSKFKGEHPCRNVMSIKLICNFIEITLLRGFYPVNLLRIFRTPFLKNNSGRLLLKIHTLSIENELLIRFDVETFKVLKYLIGEKKPVKSGQILCLVTKF